mmetsp:Transcript_48028/g.88440  ORF Transcript_48028/g.88440 Transcript_48028/m.88440 type:complete len:652 (+) Transcript_48028:32-1987(+)
MMGQHRHECPHAVMPRKGLFLLAALAGLCDGSFVSGSCGAQLERHVSAGALQSMIPAALPVQLDVISIVWQDGGVIHMNHMARKDCSFHTAEQDVNHTDAFFHSSEASSGLSDALGLADGSTVVAWTLLGQVWLRVMGPPGAPPKSQAILAHALDHYDRREVRLVAHPGTLGFIAIWSSWGQDGDAWGVFARAFTSTGEAIGGQEFQVNEYWQYFQWQPQVLACGNSLWALWMNGTGSGCDSKESDETPPYCATGPFARELSVNTATGVVATQAEVNIQEGSGRAGPIAASFACYGSRDIQVFSLYNRARGFGPAVADAAVYAKGSESATLSSSTSETGLLSGFLRWTGLKAFSSLGSFLVAADSQGFLSDASLGDGDSSSLGSGVPVSMMSKGGYVVLWYIDHKRGILQVQLKEYPLKQVYMPKAVAMGVNSVHASWDSTDEIAFILCWSTSDDIQAVDSSGFGCIRRPVTWLKPEGNLLEFGAKLVLFVVMGGLLVVCCLKYCAQMRFQRPNRQWLQQDLQSSTTRLREIREELTRVRHLQEQLNAIPSEPPPSQVSVEVGELRSADQGDRHQPTAPPAAQAFTPSVPVATTSRPPDICPICQNEISVRVAWQPCGHTACRDCGQQLVDRHQKCHICRGTIQGVLAVYL